MNKISTEQLDELQFGRQLHQRPAESNLRDCIAAVISDHARTDDRGYVINADEIAEKVLELCWRGAK